ncbi:hypothetical protein C8Q76DRAFT_607717 [Earliella scabrosa]|nr:hypothetical protein C8Q76DRAFT_607717 [Earliella scabrosa]
MIVDKPPLPGDELNIEDAPPSYDALEGVPPSLPSNEKAGPSTPRGPSHPTSPTSPTPTGSSRGKSGKRSNAWFNFGFTSRAVKEVRTTVLGLLRDLVKQGDASGALGVLESCADACKTYDLSLSSLLQEKSLEGHTPIYWAIINRSDLPPRPDEPDLVSAILSHAAPLTDETVDELRLACLHTSDHALFQKLRRSPAFSPLTGREELITGGSVPVDEVDVEDVKEDESAFVVRFRIPMFQKRLRISEAIQLEFIAKGRLWELSFLIAKDFDPRLAYKNVKGGSWVIKLVLLPHSPPTWIDSRLVIEDPRAHGHPNGEHASASSGAPTSLIEASAKTGSEETPQGKPKPPIQLRLKAREQLSPPRYSAGPMIILSLEENASANSLQFNGCPYLGSDGSLTARLEARLAQPAEEAECIIC